MTAAVRYRVEVRDAHAHLFGITLEVDQPGDQLQVSLPVWIPGSYMVREFSQHLQGLRGQADGQAVALQALSKHRWHIQLPAHCRCLTLQYEVYAFDASVRTAFLDASRGFFNPTSLCLRVEGREDEPQLLEMVAPADRPDWSLATALPALQAQTTDFGRYLAADYDELADSPVEMGRFWQGQFSVRGVPHRLVVSGATAHFDGDRLLQDCQRICAAAIDLWHPAGEAPPFDRYLFLLHASADGYGGLEHRHSTALICQRSDLPRHRPGGDSGQTPALKASDGYTALLGLISHEYFHAWNVKRLRPHALAHYDYDRENYTDQLWFFEGFTSYYDDLLLLRASLISEAVYLQLLSKTLNQVLQTPGRHLQTLAQASWDAWIKYYRVQENTPNATVSYYTKGALVALCLDLTLRTETPHTLDEVMRGLYQRCAGGPMTEDDLLQVLQQVGGRSYQPELQAWVHSTTDLPLRALLERHGVQWQEDEAPLAQRLGLRVSEEARGLILKNVLRGSAAEAAGMAAGDEWVALDSPGPHGTHSWRIRRLDDVALHATESTQTLVAWVARDGRLLRCPLTWPEPCHTVQLKRSATG